MRVLIAIVAVSVVFVPVGCGESDTASSSDGTHGVERAGRENSKATRSESTVEAAREYQARGPFATVSLGKGNARPEIDPPDRPPPGKTLIRDLEVGTGPVARLGDKIVVSYVGINYETGEQQYGFWPPDRPTHIQLTFEGESKAWEEAIDGMRGGGIREMIIPSHLLFDTGTIDYVLKLMRVEPGRLR